MSEKEVFFDGSLKRLIFFSLTLGLSPFYPEPHIIDKLGWIMEGGIGMGGWDWFDVVLHGTPWFALLMNITRKLIKRI